MVYVQTIHLVTLFDDSVHRSRFSSLSWGQAATCQGSLPLGIIGGGMADGVLNFWNPDALIAGRDDALLSSQAGAHEGKL